MSEDIVSLSSLETERFGVIAARCSVATADNFEQVLVFCREHRVGLLRAAAQRNIPPHTRSNSRADDWATRSSITSAPSQWPWPPLSRPNSWFARSDQPTRPR